MVEGERDRWTSRIAFYFAAVGAAVGFGNIWRFPSLAADYGGGAFFIPYLLALFLIGIPILILEISLGQFYQTGDVGVFGSFNRRWKGVGVSSVSLAYMVVTYYAVLIAWVINGFFDSFRSGAPWTNDEITSAEATKYFIDEVIGAKTVGDDGLPTRIVPMNVVYSAITWLIIWLCLAGGAEWTGRITYFSMGLPIVAIFVFLFKAVSLEGSDEGIKQYIGIWDLDVLTDRPDCWSTAVSQIFFSIGVTFGIMTALGSYNDRGDPAVMHSLVIACANSSFSFIAGFAVFAALGHLAFLEGVEVTDLPSRGFSLLFGTYPVVFGKLAGGIHWIRLLFFTMFLLGIDSGFGLLEGGLTAAADTVYLSKFKKWQLAGMMSVLGFLFSLIYCTDAGFNFLDATDYYINFVMLLVGFFETFAAGWIFGLEAQMKQFGKNAVICYLFANFGSVLIACAFWFGLKKHAMIVGFIVLAVLYLGGVAATAYFMKPYVASSDRWTWGSAAYELAFGNVMDLRRQLSETVGYLPWAWAVMIKQFIPHVLLILFINLARAEGGLGVYGGYAQWPYQALGYASVFFGAVLFFAGLFFPDLYNGLSLVDEKMVLRATGDDDGVVPEQAFKGKELEDESPNTGKNFDEKNVELDTSVHA